jgi:hypothetical protein
MIRFDSTPPKTSGNNGTGAHVSGMVLFLCVGALLGALGLFGWYAAKRRREELGTWAQTCGLSFSESREYGLDDRYPELDALRKGDHRYAYNTLRGQWQKRPFYGFDYHYETHSTDSKGRRQTHHHNFSAVILDSDVPLQPLLIRPEGLFDKLAGVFGFEDINFESAEFSRKFYVKAPNKKWAYDVIHPRCMEFLLSMPQFTLQFAPGCVIACRDGTLRADEFTQAADVVTGILDRLPEYVVQQQKADV